MRDFKRRGLQHNPVRFADVAGVAIPDARSRSSSATPRNRTTKIAAARTRPRPQIRDRSSCCAPP